jgi:lantibiotic modifying enzyme
MVAHLEKRLFDSASGEDVHEEIEDALIEMLRDPPASFAAHDVVIGLLGTGTYALERFPAGKSTAILELLVQRLAATAESSPGGKVRWLSTAEQSPGGDAENFPSGQYYLGLSHGAAGVIAMLASIQALGIEAKTASSLIRGAVTWLLSERFPEKMEGVFPMALGKEVTPTRAPLGWCHGELGISLALLLAGRLGGEEDWVKEARRLAFAGSQRRRTEPHGWDPCLCHGHTSRAHLFNRWYQQDGDERFRQEALYWIERAMALARPGEGLGGYSTENLPNVMFQEGIYAHKPLAGFLMGAVGVALALLAAATDCEPGWDRVLLISPARQLGTLNRHFR